MIFIILIVIGVLGMIGTLSVSSGSLRYKEHPVAKGSEWFSVNPEVLESRLGAKIREETRGLIKIILIWLIKQYRDLSQKITVKQTVKKKIRAFLYDHDPDGKLNPSEFWNQVRHPQKTKRSKKHPVAVIIEETIIQEPETPENFMEGQNVEEGL